MIHAHARARWTGRTLRVEIEGWVDPGMPARQADEIGREVADAIAGSSPKRAALPGPPAPAPADHYLCDGGELYSGPLAAATVRDLPGHDWGGRW